MIVRDQSSVWSRVSSVNGRVSLALIYSLIVLLQTVSSQLGDENANSNQDPNNANTNNVEPLNGDPKSKPPSFVHSASYISLDGLGLIIIFDRPVQLNESIEILERKQTNSTNQARSYSKTTSQLKEFVDLVKGYNYASESYQENDQSISGQCGVRQSGAWSQSRHLTEKPVQGIQLCGKLLAKKTLRLLHKYKLFNCLWSSRIQFIIQLMKPIGNGNSLRVAFKPNLIRGQGDSLANEKELTIELNKLPLESLGLPLEPKLALTGPNQVPVCGQFSLSAHLSSPFGTFAGDSVKLSWSVEQIGAINQQANSSNAAASTSLELASSNDLKWKALQHLVSNSRGNNLLLDSQLFNKSPTKYEFKIFAQFRTTLTTISLNATHQIEKLDFDAPIGTIYGSHILNHQQPLINTEQELLLLADIQVPYECVSKTILKQVGLYWQVSDPRVHFDQTYAPYYIARANTLPEFSQIEFRLNSFYGIRVKKYASSGTLIKTGEHILDSEISDGLLVMSLSESSTGDLELFATSSSSKNKIDHDKFTYQWSCFDGKTAQPCYKRNSTSSTISGNVNSTIYELSLAAQNEKLQAQQQQRQDIQLLIDKMKQRLPTLRLPLAWLESDAQLWFGLQRFDRMNPSQSSKTEYALIKVQQNSDANSQQRLPVITIGPVLMGKQKQKATIRNPLTGAVLLLEQTSATVIGRLSPRQSIKSFRWLAPNYIQPLNWLTRNETNPLTGQDELVTELYLNPTLQAAYNHLQLYLVACTTSSGDVVGQQVSANLNLDVVQGISQCRVELNQSPLTSSMTVSIDYCNIPLGLSPITYQIYMFESKSMGTKANGNTSANDDDYINESDQFVLDSLAKPITMPQLSPVFRLNELSAQSILKTLLNPGSSGAGQENSAAGFRFGARVCDRLQSCKMFYSKGINLSALAEFNSVPVLPVDSSMSNNLNLVGSSSNQTSAALLVAPASDPNSKSSIDYSSPSKTLESLIDSSRRANLAGNSIAAISILNGAINVAQKALSNLRQQKSQTRNNPDEIKLRELLQSAINICLQYCSVSLQRQFHYTDSGQTNLVLQTLSNLLSIPQTNLESKFKTLKLVIQLQRKSQLEQLMSANKLQCLANFKTIQSAYESIFGTFSHYSLQEHQQRHQDVATLSSESQKLQRFNQSHIEYSTASQQSAPPKPNAKHQHHKHEHLTGKMSKTINRRKREEAILTYLKTARHAHKSLIASAAMQLPLGSTRHFYYNDLTSSADNQTSAAVKPTSDIVSTLIHLIELENVFSKQFELNLGDFGTISFRFNVMNSDFLLNTKERGGESTSLFDCKRSNTSDPQSSGENNNNNKCSSVILLITTYSGKAPFRSLDEGKYLKVPIVELTFLSPVDGTNLIDSNGQQSKPLGKFKLHVTFSVPTSRLQLSNPFKFNEEKYKCYLFDEDSNEWVIQAGDGEQASELNDNDNNTKIRCAFNSIGVLAAFQGSPPLSETTIKTSVGLILVIIVVLVALFSILGCLASSSKDKKRRNSDTSDEDDSFKRVDNIPHPEQSHRNDYNYPIH